MYCVYCGDSETRDATLRLTSLTSFYKTDRVRLLLLAEIESSLYLYIYLNKNLSQSLVVTVNIPTAELSCCRQ